MSPVPEEDYVPDLTPVLAAGDRSERAEQPGASAFTILSAVGETMYEWDLETDRIRWAANAADIFGLPDIAPLETGAGFEACVDPQSLTDRNQAVRNGLGVDYGRGVAFDIDYGLRLPSNSDQRTVWVNDRGIWYGDAQGTPYLARGVIRTERNRPALILPKSGAALPRRREFLKLLEGTLAVAHHYHSLYVFALLSIDNLTSISEVYDADAEEEVEAALARALTASLRSGDVAGWISDGELGLVLRVANEPEANAAIGRITTILAQQNFATAAGPASPRISTGAVMIPTAARSVDEALSLVREAQRGAKLKGSGHFVIHTERQSQHRKKLGQAAIARLLSKALHENTLTLVRQPVVRSRDRSIAFEECLLRLVDEEGTLIPMGDAIAVAESLGLMRMIDFRVQDMVFEILRRERGTTLSFNLSAESTRQPGWVAAFEQNLQRSPELADRIIIEITETSLIEDIDAVRDFVLRVRRLGCRVAIDDFGAGYTSFRNLKLLPVNILKIDGSFIRQLASTEKDRLFVKMLHELARSLDLETVAEMVEDAASARELTELGIDYLQGFHTGRPVAAPAAASLAAPVTALGGAQGGHGSVDDREL
ncbi:diguanylate cyclase/phosphodiesterase [Faunimonas pinastri]|uniref:Diguanylate cyclase/phosphodiesterase n=1 Tax=Faunimonas pinastri TaxID=1855383 RepID=A0A1H9HUU2_9HYPH|nr:GGDEF domain-containing phosphodiesterase [Faunimonas pinastri]SEQ66113.1 diguanylate cyclase/phosphodiesterase [Faunimonas pinastri]